MVNRLPSNLLENALIEGLIAPERLISSLLFRLSERDIMDMIETDFTYLIDGTPWDKLREDIDDDG